jgi:hypothetical protein
MPALANNLELKRCPHCSTANPNLSRIHDFETQDHQTKNRRYWRIYVCQTCGGAVSAYATDGFNQAVREFFPAAKAVDATLPDRVREYLQQATDSIHAPAGAVMLAASCVDAMLKDRGYKEGSLYARIDTATKAGVITPGMAEWAHDVRLDANDQRHADSVAALPGHEDARRAVEFASALADLLFVLPARVKRGLRKQG